MYIDFAPLAGNRQRAQDHEQWFFTVFFTDFTKKQSEKCGQARGVCKFAQILYRLGVNFTASASPWRAFHRLRVTAMVEIHRLRRSLDQSLLPRIVRTERIQRHSFDVS